MYTPREARFATRSEIVSILKNAREKREEEERRRRWAEFSATKIVNILTNWFRLVRKQQQNEVSKVHLQKNYIYLHCFAYSNTVPELSKHNSRFCWLGFTRTKRPL